MYCLIYIMMAKMHLCKHVLMLSTVFFPLFLFLLRSSFFETAETKTSKGEGLKKHFNVSLKHFAIVKLNVPYWKKKKSIYYTPCYCLI